MYVKPRWHTICNSYKATPTIIQVAMTSLKIEVDPDRYGLASAFIHDC